MGPVAAGPGVAVAGPIPGLAAAEAEAEAKKAAEGCVPAVAGGHDGASNDREAEEASQT